MAAYAVVSVLIALAPSAPVLIGLRFLQGVAGGTGVVVARAIVRDRYAGVEAAKFFSRLTLIFGVAPIAAPALGSLVLKVTSWHGIFVALAVIAAALTALTAIWLPETLPPERRSPGGLAAFGRTARSLVTDRTYLGYALSQAFAFAAMFAYISGSPFVLQDGYGLSPTVFSVLFGVNAAGLVAVSQLNRRLLDHRSPRSLLMATLVLETVAAAVVLASAAAGLVAGVAAGLFLLVASLGMVTPNSTALALDRHPERAGTAAALLGGIQSVVASVAAPLAGIGDPGRGVPMAVVIAGFAVAALLAVVTLTSAPVRPLRGPRASPPPGPA
jgi:DHA1 family bicyclomycin/chloramphenicol resistance-like MFS transporter